MAKNSRKKLRRLPAQKAAKKEASKEVVVDIAFSGRNFSYKATSGPGGSLRVARGTIIRWTCSRPAAILFDPATPFGHMAYSNGKKGELRHASGSRKRELPGAVTLPGRFKYYVAVHYNGRVFIDDPEVIVNY
jgi:hypothetical protein